MDLFRALAGTALRDHRATLELYTLVQRLARANANGNDAVADEITQTVALRVLAKAREVLERLLERHPDVRARCATAEAVWAHPEPLPGMAGRVHNYLAAAATNAARDLRRRQRRRQKVPLAPTEGAPDPADPTHHGNTDAPGADGPDGLEPQGVAVPDEGSPTDKVNALVKSVQAAFTAEQREAFRQVIALASKETTMDDLVAAHPNVSTEEEQRRIRDRLYKQHQRVRQRFAAAVEAQREAGTLPATHADGLIEWCTRSLRRRQIRDPSSVSKDRRNNP